MDDIKKAYNSWASQYDTNENKTRDLEALALRKTLSNFEFSNVLEIGCGTGKNSEWFVSKAKTIVAVDFSEEMLAKAKLKIKEQHIQFQQTDITQSWNFTNEKFDLITFSLVLEHIETLDFIFSEIKKKIAPGGLVYIGELHPFKQYQGSMARFDAESGTVQLRCYTHNISEFLNISRAHGFSLASFEEWFDDDNREAIPRILTIVFQSIDQ